MYSPELIQKREQAIRGMLMAALFEGDDTRWTKDEKNPVYRRQIKIDAKHLLQLMNFTGGRITEFTPIFYDLMKHEGVTNCKIGEIGEINADERNTARDLSVEISVEDFESKILPKLHSGALRHPVVMHPLTQGGFRNAVKSTRTTQPFTPEYATVYNMLFGKGHSVWSGLSVDLGGDHAIQFMGVWAENHKLSAKTREAFTPLKIAAYDLLERAGIPRDNVCFISDAKSERTMIGVDSKVFMRLRSQMDPTGPGKLAKLATPEKLTFLQTTGRSR